jgi:hypothetical protein
LSSWWWAVCHPKHVEQLRNTVIINSTTRLHLVGYFYEIRYNSLFAELWNKNHACQLAFNTGKAHGNSCNGRLFVGCFTGHSNTTDGPSSFHINKDKGLEAYGGPNFPLPNLIPSRTVGKLIGPHDRG